MAAEPSPPSRQQGDPRALPRSLVQFLAAWLLGGCVHFGGGTAALIASLDDFDYARVLAAERGGAAAGAGMSIELCVVEGTHRRAACGPWEESCRSDADGWTKGCASVNPQLHEWCAPEPPPVFTRAKLEQARAVENRIRAASPDPADGG